MRPRARKRAETKVSKRLLLKRQKALQHSSLGSYEEGIKALSELDRVRQVEAIESYNSMKSSLMGYLKSFAEGKKVVREEDIRNFFENMKGKKEGKGVNVPNFCN